MTEPSPSRFFALVLRPETTLAVSALVVLGTYVGVGSNDPERHPTGQCARAVGHDDAAATGYRERALSGHFDPVLVVGSARTSVAAWHWAVSVAPGAVVWVALGTILIFVGPTAIPTPFTASGLVAFVYVSSVAWAIALPLTRYATGVIWIVALLMLGGSTELLTLHGAFLTESGRWQDLLSQAGACLICPLFLVEHTDAALPTSLLLVTIATLGIMVAGAWFISTLDAPLKVRR